MKKIGLYLVLFGVGSFILNMFDMEFRLMSWVDSWGAGPGLMIRGAFVLVGGVLAGAGFLAENGKTAT